ncbi:cupin [Shewanella algicola]|uniref:Cupin-like domain-containing protein n=2 Tax=Shewanella algicola TaxID=640633 RepID=A0A9X1Z4S3_9GAMM|nr:cupin-like domain-containing protein [Shewanella algicola]MCL1106071.1 cupin-like domain-containing protein [Shewanella algicola]GGP45979.1 cupin [Shewanella algicola]
MSNDTLTAVDCVSDWTLAQVMAHIEQADKPMVFKGLCRHWPLVQAGLESSDKALDYLRQFYQGYAVTAYHIAPEQQGRVFYNQQLDGFNYQAGRLDFNQLLARLQQENASANPTGIYMGSTDIHQCLPGLGEQNSLNLQPINPLTSIWLGNKTKVAAHFDFPLNLACNVVGKRTFTLFPPEQICNLYVGPMEFAPGGQDISMVDFDKPDFERFPQFQQALDTALTAELMPGDVLFIPSMWWHHVRGIDDINVLITHWWRDTPGYLGRPNNALLHSMLSLRSLPKAQRQAWKAMFDHYIFDHDDVDDSYIPDTAKGMLSKPLDELNARKLRADLINKLKR